LRLVGALRWRICPDRRAKTGTAATLESAEYLYDGDGRLVRSIVNNATSFYAGRIIIG
jgi:hypothetical protein